MITVSRTDWAMAQQIVVTGTGTHTVVISGGPRSTTVTTSGDYTVEHFAIREATAIDANVAVFDGSTILKSSSGTVAARPAHSAAPIGYQIAPHLHDAATTLGLVPAPQVVRFGIAWSTAQPSSSAWDTTQRDLYDAVFTELDSRNIQAIVTCGTTPAWARSGGTILSPATDPANHGAFVDSIVDRWGDSILCVDPWNEPNLDSFWTGTDAQYVSLLDAVRTAVDPAMPVSLSGGISLGDYEWVDGLFDVGLDGTMFDWVDVHPYPTSWGEDAAGANYHPSAMPPPAALDGSPIAGTHKIESVLASHGVTGKPLVVSEVGVSTNPIDSASPKLRLTDQDAATWIGLCIDQLRRIPHMQAVCVHEAKDQSSTPGWASTFGLLDPGNVRRASWALMDALI